MILSASTSEDHSYTLVRPVRSTGQSSSAISLCPWLCPACLSILCPHVKRHASLRPSSICVAVRVTASLMSSSGKLSLLVCLLAFLRHDPTIWDDVDRVYEKQLGNSWNSMDDFFVYLYMGWPLSGRGHVTKFVIFTPRITIFAILDVRAFKFYTELTRE